MGSLPKVDRMGEENALNRLSAAGDSAGSGSARPIEGPNELWEWLRLLNRRKALIVGAGLVAVVLMALVIAQATPMYKASSRIMLDTRAFNAVRPRQAFPASIHSTSARSRANSRSFSRNS